jgi:hypothetical protein
VCVQQDTRRTLTDAPHHRGLAIVDGKQIGLHARIREQSTSQISSLVHGLSGESGEGARRDAHEILEVCLELRHQFTDGLTEGFDSAGAHAAQG